MDDRIRTIEDRVTKLETDTSVIRVEQTHISKGVDEIQDTLTWLLRLVVGGIVLAGVGFVINGGLAI